MDGKTFFAHFIYLNASKSNLSIRGDLSEPSIKAEVDRGYELAVDFFDKYL